MKEIQKIFIKNHEVFLEISINSQYYYIKNIHTYIIISKNDATTFSRRSRHFSDI